MGQVSIGELSRNRAAGCESGFTEEISRQSSRIIAQDYQRLLEKLFKNPTVKKMEDLRRKGNMSSS